MKKGTYYKQVGGYRGSIYDGKTWHRFDCDGCVIGAYIVDPKDRMGGSTLAARNAIQYKKSRYPHDHQFHNALIHYKRKYGKPMPINHPEVVKYRQKYGLGPWNK